MRSFFSFFCLTIAVASVVHAAPPSREESVFLFENRKLTVTLPEGFGWATAKDEDGMVNIRLADPKDRVSVELRFLPDPESRMANARARKELMNEMFNEFVGTSTEKAMRFEELQPQTGAGTYCVFTDASLVGKTTFPPGEYLHLTTGLKAWPGVVAVFRFFSRDTTSPEYEAVMKMLRESVHERNVPLK